MSNAVPTIILGATGYVAGELLRLLAGHPGLSLLAAVSESKAGTAIGDIFPHLLSSYEATPFTSPDHVDGLVKSHPRLAVFSALPHGEAATRLAAMLELAQSVGCDMKLVDLSADFRFPSADIWEAIYGEKHGAPAWCHRFTCAVPEHFHGVPDGPVAHPGCFTTCVTTACYALQSLGLAEPVYRVAAVTGASGSGRSPKPGTHFPERHGNHYSYSALTHRHEAEMNALVAWAGGPAPKVLFVPHSGSFSRGIHATIHIELKQEMSSKELLVALADFYAPHPFIRVKKEMPTVKEVAGTNEVRLSAVSRGRDAVVFSAIDNLTKGAAGGGVQWMNRLLGFEETAGLRLPGLGWQ